MNKRKSFHTVLFFIGIVCSLRSMASDAIAGGDSGYAMDTAISKNASHPEKTDGFFMLSWCIGLNSTADDLANAYKANTTYSTGFDRRNGSKAIYNMGVNYIFSNRLVGGIGLSYQKIPIIVSGPTTPANNFQAWTFTDTWMRIAVSLSGDYYLVRGDEIAIYAGVRLGYNSYSMSRVGDASAFPGFQTTDLSPPVLAAQLHVGFYGFVTPHFGVNVEIGPAYGGPYFAAVGLTVKF